MIEFKGVSKKFGDVSALENVSFRVKNGEFVFFIGASGSGKTTLVRLLLREFLPTEGEIFIDNIRLADISKKKAFTVRRKLGVIFQDFKLLSDRTVRENVLLPLGILEKDDKESLALVDRALEIVGLKERGNFFPSELAGGEVQRVCIARAIVGEPSVIIADEPTGNLDPTTSWQIVRLLKKINKTGKTVIMMTHNFEIVNCLNERVIELESGKIISDKANGKYEIKK